MKIRLISLLLAFGIIAGAASGCSMGTDDPGSQIDVSDGETNEDADNSSEYSFIKCNRDVTLEEAEAYLGRKDLEVNTITYDSDQKKALFYAIKEEKLYELDGADEGSVNRLGNTIHFTITETDPYGVYHIDIATGKTTRTTVFEDMLQVPEDDSMITKIYYGEISDDKYVEIYEVNGHLYMRDKFEIDGKDTFYSVQRVNSAINFDMYAVRRMEENQGEKYFLNSQYMLVDPYEKNRVIYKENLDDSMTDSSSLMTIIGASKYGTSRSILIGRKTDGDEHGTVKYTDVRIFHIEDRTVKNRDNNCYYDPLKKIVQYRSNMYGVIGTNVDFPSNISLYPTGINNVFEIYFPESSDHSPFSPSNEWAVLHLANNMYFNVSSIPCGTLPPTNIAEFVDENSSIGVKYLRVDFVYMGNDTRRYFNENTREVLTEEELPQDVSLVPCEKDDKN